MSGPGLYAGIRPEHESLVKERIALRIALFNLTDSRFAAKIKHIP